MRYHRIARNPVIKAGMFRMHSAAQSEHDMDQSYATVLDGEIYIYVIQWYPNKLRTVKAGTKLAVHTDAHTRPSDCEISAHGTRKCLVHTCATIE